MTNLRSFDYRAPPALGDSLAQGTTWGLRCDCTACPRGEIVVDVIGLIERYANLEFDAMAVFERAHCRQCGNRLKRIGGFVLRALQRNGKMPRLVVAGGGDLRAQPFADRLPC